MKLSLSGKVSIASNLVALLCVGLAWHGIPSSAPLPYAVHKVMHLVGVIIFMGNLIAGPLWIWMAYYGEDGKHYPFAARALAAADIWLTAPGVQLAIWNGLWLAASFGGVRSNKWLIEALLWLVVTSMVSLVLVIPMQERMVAAAQGDDRRLARATLVRWSIWGSAVMIPMSLVGWIMVAKMPVFLAVL